MPQLMQVLSATEIGSEVMLSPIEMHPFLQAS
jgi:hypothetical protein